MNDTTWLVASSNDIPLFDHSVDVMTAIFSPVQVTEAARVLDEYGTLVIAAPGEKHLWELREALYPEVRAHEPEKWLEGLASAFTCNWKQRCISRSRCRTTQRTQPAADDTALLACGTRATCRSGGTTVTDLAGGLPHSGVQQASSACF
jgi:hypothetical protein